MSVARRRSQGPGWPKPVGCLPAGKSQIETARTLRVSRATIQRAYQAAGADTRT